MYFAIFSGSKNGHTLRVIFNLSSRDNERFCLQIRIGGAGNLLHHTDVARTQCTGSLSCTLEETFITNTFKLQSKQKYFWCENCSVL